MSQQSINADIANTHGVGYAIDPTNQFDTTRGYGVGSKIFNYVTGREFICLDATPEAAVWKTSNELEVSLRRAMNTSMYIFPITFVPSTATGTVSANVLYAAPVVRPGAVINRLGINVTTPVAGNCRLGIYANDPKTGLPSTLLVDAGVVATGVGGTFEATIPDFKIPSGGCWVAAVFSAAPSCTSGAPSGVDLVGHGGFQAVGRGLSYTFAYGALPATYGPANATPSAMPGVMVGLRYV